MRNNEKISGDRSLCEFAHISLIDSVLHGGERPTSGRSLDEPRSIGTNYASASEKHGPVAGLPMSVGWQGESQAAIVNVTVTFQNLAPVNSVSFAPLRVGFNNGTFDSFNIGTTATHQLFPSLRAAAAPIGFQPLQLRIQPLCSVAWAVP